MNYELRIKKSRNAGYTIIETMIAVSLFIIIVMMGMGALLNANLLHQKSQSMRSIIDNLSFVMEDMSRNLRTGYSYHCLTAETEPRDSLPVTSVSAPKSCASGWGIAFEFANGDLANNDDQWVYYIDATLNPDGTTTGKIFKSTQGPSNILPNFIQLTPNEIVINTTASSFTVVGAEPPPGNSQQPFITLNLVGTITFKGVESPFSLRTSVSQRLIDTI